MQFVNEISIQVFKEKDTRMVSLMVSLLLTLCIRGAIATVYSKLCQTPEMELFTEIVNSFYS